MEQQALNKIAEAVVLSLRQVLQSKNIDATGDLSRSIKYVVSPKFIEIEMLQYGAFVDSGSKPHSAPIEPLKRWVKAKNLSINPWAVRANIKKFGTAPHKWIYKFRESILDLDEELLDYMGIIIEKDFDDKFRKIWQ